MDHIRFSPNFILTLLLSMLALSAVGEGLLDDQSKTFEEITLGYGFPFEKYIVTTEDGYNLETFRIKHGRDQDPSVQRPAIIIQHGIFDSADFVVSHGPDDSPAFYLADLGYDIWVSDF